MNLGLHIFNLLQEKGKVELPGFGVFTLQKKSAQLDPETSTLLPPAQEIHFQSSKLVLGSDLSIYIAEKTGGNLFDIQSQIKEEVLNWHKELAENKNMQVNELGEFLEKNGEISLISKKDFTQNPNYFGLEEISLKEIKLQKFPILEDEETDNQYVFSHSVLWSFLLIIPVGAILYLALNYQDQLFGKKSFGLTVKTSTHRIEKTPIKKDSLKKDSVKIAK